MLRVDITADNPGQEGWSCARAVHVALEFGDNLAWCRWEAGLGQGRVAGVGRGCEMVAGDGARVGYGCAVGS